MQSRDLPGTADAVIVGGGTVGAWCAYFLRQAGLSRVVLLEKGMLGQGASSRAAGVVRLQGGTPEAVRLGRWSREFYLRQHAELGCDSGFVTQGYLLPCFTEAEVAAARSRMAMQISLGVPVRWLDSPEVDEANPALAPGQTMGGTFCADDGYITAARNVTAYTVALLRSGVQVAEHVAFLGLQVSGGRVAGVTTSDGGIATGLVVLTGGPKLAAVGRLAGIRIPAGGARHQVAVTEQHPDLHPSRVPMVFDLSAGLYWRPEEGGLLFGMSNPDEPPGEDRSVDLDYLALMRERLARLVPVTAGLGLRRLWAATIDFTPDHLPIIGPALGPAGQLDGVTVACAGGAGMMWGPAVSRAAADVALTGATDVVDVSVLGLGRFDEAGHSSLAADPVALPFPQALLTQQAPPSPPAVSFLQEQPVPQAPGVQRTRALPNAQAGRQAEPPCTGTGQLGEDPSAMTTTSLDPPFLVTASSVELEDWGALPEATGEPMHTSGTTIWKDGGQEAGVWECTPGRSHWTLESNEFVYVLYGRMTVTTDGSDSTEIGPGDTAVFPKGWTGTWHIHETMRKLYVLF